MNFIRNKNARLFLFLNAILWGSSYVWSGMLLVYLPRYSILLFKYIGGIPIITVLFFSSVKKITIDDIFPSLLVSIFAVLSNISLIIALEHTSSSETAFIVQSTVVITPVIMAIKERHMPDRKVIIGAIVSLAGLFLITYSSTSFRINVGDIFAFCSAVFFSIYLIGQKHISTRVNTTHFIFLHYIFTSTIFAFLAGFTEFSYIKSISSNISAFILPMLASITVSLLTVLFQSEAIKYATPGETALIYIIEPIVALILGSILIGGQIKGIKSITGCFLIITAVFFSVSQSLGKKKK